MTRRETFLRRRAKYLRRAFLMYQRGWTYELRPAIAPPHVMHWFPVARVEPLWNGDLQGISDVKDAEALAHLHRWDGGVPSTYTLPTIDNAHPPHPKLTGFWRARSDLRAPRWERVQVLGYFNRRVHWVGRKPGRMTGRERSIWGAGFHAINNGYFPEWDPLHRHPNEQDVLDGLPTYDGPYPQTPRGE